MSINRWRRELQKIDGDSDKANYYYNPNPSTIFHFPVEFLNIQCTKQHTRFKNYFAVLATHYLAQIIHRNRQKIIIVFLLVLVIRFKGRDEV